MVQTSLSQTSSRVTSPATRTLQGMLGTALPIIQAPMAGVQGSAMAVAVSQAGGLGSLPPCATLSLEVLRTELQVITQQTAKPYNVNFFCHTVPAHQATQEAAWRTALAPFYAEHGIDADSIAPGAGRAPFTHAVAGVLEAFKPPVVSFHFGLPAPDLLARVKSWGAVVLSSATTVAEAQWLHAHGADAIIAQGLEAGGIADAQGVRAALALGAAGVQVGTAYMLCPEATTSAVHRAALQSAGAQHNALTTLFTGRPARGIVNRVMRQLGPLCPAAAPFPTATAAIAPLRAAAESQGLGDFTSLWSGQNTSGCKPVPAAHITRELAQGLVG